MSIFRTIRKYILDTFFMILFIWAQLHTTLYIYLCVFWQISMSSNKMFIYISLCVWVTQFIFLYFFVIQFKIYPENKYFADRGNNINRRWNIIKMQWMIQDFFKEYGCSLLATLPHPPHPLKTHALSYKKTQHHFIFLSKTICIHCGLIWQII